MYCRLAWGNVRTSLRDYGIYLLTIALGVAVFYAFNTMSEQASFFSKSTVEILEFLSNLITGVTVMLAIVLGFLMVYANNFLVRRRKRELGLYQVLGMTKRQVSIVICLECGIASLLAFAIGLGAGILLSQFLVFITAALFNDTITQFGFIFSTQGLALAALCFGVMFCVTLVFDILIVGKVRIVDLVQGERRVESARLRPVWLCAPLAVAGVVVIAIAYWRLLRDGMPVMLDDSDGEMGAFALTTLLCVVGTLALFWGLPSPAMAILRRLKGYYLRDLHLFTVRQVASRVNSSSIAMAVTALVLFLAMTSVTTGMSIANGLNQSLANGAPLAASTTAAYFHPEEGSYSMPAATADEYEGVDFPLATRPVDMAAWFEATYPQAMPLVTALNQVEVYTAAPRGYDVDEGSYERDGIAVLGAFGQVSGRPLPERFASLPNTSLMQVMTISQYNADRALVGMEPVELASDKYLFLCNLGPTIIDYYDAGLAAGTPFRVGGRLLTPAQPQCVSNASAALYDGANGTNSGTLVVADELVGDLPLIDSILQIQSDPAQEAELERVLADVESATLERGDDYGVFEEGGLPVAFITMFATKAEIVAAAGSMTGLIGYLATYIGFVLVVGCAAILAIQQLSQTADSLGRYRLLHELGAPAGQVAHSLFSQTALCFGLPLAVGLAHSLVAVRVVREVMELMAPVDVTSSLSLAAVIFVVVYGGYFLATYLMAKRLADARNLGLRLG